MTDPADPVVREPVAAAPSPRWMRWLLVASLSANLLVVGLVAGAVLRHGDPRSRGMPADITFGPLTQALTREDRRALRDGFIARAPNFREDMRAVRADMQTLLATLRADPWDEATARTALLAIETRIGQRVETGRDLLLERIGTMSPAERAAFADRVAEMLRRPPKRLDAPPGP